MYKMEKQQTHAHTRARSRMKMETQKRMYSQFSTFFMCCSVANALKQMCELKTLSRASTFISSALFFSRSILLSFFPFPPFPFSLFVVRRLICRRGAVFFLSLIPFYAFGTIATEHIPPLTATIRSTLSYTDLHTP